MMATDFKLLADAGGLLDQDAALFDDLSNLAMLYQRRKPSQAEKSDDEESDEKPQGFPSYLSYL